ncbi:MAG: hypothetical protein H6686_00590 [Fibrobacteria bacterium]|nr:hypothetical protein [Fibrobacteria bacterium]
MIAALILSLLPSTSQVFGSGFPKDSTTAWCDKLPYQEAIYKCFPNPWGSSATHVFIRFPDTSIVGGCLTGTSNVGDKLYPEEWIFIGGHAPFLPRITFDQSKECLDGYLGLVINHAAPGDSIDLEFWMTPRDTVVSDTIRGWFKAYYRGDLIGSTGIPLRGESSPRSVLWTPSGVILPSSWQGPYRLFDLKGRSFPLRTSHEGDKIRLQPATVLPPGLYRLVWPGGSSGILVPSKPR